MKFGRINLSFVPFLPQSILFPEFVLFIDFKVKDGEVTFDALLMLFLCQLHELIEMSLELLFKSCLLLDG
jgi:hypothetical protein